MSAQLNQLAFSFAIPANVIRHPVVNTKPITQSVARAAIEIGRSRDARSMGVTWEFIELREQHSQHDEIRAEYALLRSIVADRFTPRYINPNDPSDQLEIGGEE